MLPEKCLNQYCEVALKVEEIHGEIKSQLSAGAEIMKSLAASQKVTFERMEQLLDRYERRIEGLEKDHKDQIEALHGRIDALKEISETRINALEKKTWWASGAAAGLSFAYTTVMSNIRALMHGGGGGG